MKKTDINNPEISVRDERLLELDKIVTKVKQSEEWEAVSMDLIDIGISRGIQQGLSQGEMKKLISLIAKKKTKNFSVEETADMLEAEIPLVQQIYDALEDYNAKTQWKDIMTLIQ